MNEHDSEFCPLAVALNPAQKKLLLAALQSYAPRDEDSTEMGRLNKKIEDFFEGSYDD